MPPTVTKTFCRICVAFCGLEVETDGATITKVRPDKDNPFNWRDFCLKGGSSNKVRDHEMRLTTPLKRVGDAYVPVTYEQAIKEIGDSLNAIRKQHGARAIATYSGNPGMLNTTSGMFQAGFLAGLKNTNNYSAVSVDTSNLHLVSREMYGCELALLIPDVDSAKCFLLIGTNPAVSTLGWLSNVPDGWNRLLATQTNGADLIVVDPRQTATTKKANTHLLVQPGEDWALLLGIIKVIFANGWEHQQDCMQATGIDRIKTMVAEASLTDLAERCGIAVNDIEDVAKRFGKAKTGFCLAHTGVAHNRNGTLGEWLSHVLNLITGRTDRPGGRYYNPGIFKNTMEFLSRPSRVTSPSRIGGFKPIYNCYPMATLADEILTPGKAQIRALIIDGGNPVVSGPDGGKLDKALQKLDLLIAIDLFQRESHQHADWLIPGSHFLEREELTSMIGPLFEQPYIQLGQAAIEPIAGVKPEWEFYRDLTLYMGLPFMGSRLLNGVIRVSRWLAKLTKNKKLAFNPRWLWFITIKTMSKIKWRDLVNKPSGFFYAKKSYGHFRPSLQTDDGKIHAAPDMFVNVLMERLATSSRTNNPDYPFFLVNQRRKSMMNSWLVETVKRKDVYGEYVEISPEDARAMALAENELLQVKSKTSAVTAKVRITAEVPKGIVSMDHGWGSRLFDPQNNTQSEGQGVNRNLLIASDDLDELTGMPNLNGTRVNLFKIDKAR